MMLSIGIGAAAATRSKAKCIVTEAMSRVPAREARDGRVEQADGRVEIAVEEGADLLLRLSSRIDG
jgi:hypothetical protein